MRPLIALCIAMIWVSPARAEYPPDVLTTLFLEESPTEITLGENHVYYTDHVQIHRMSPALGVLNSWQGPVCYAYGLAFGSGSIYVSDGAAGFPCSIENLFRFLPTGSLIRAWCPGTITEEGEVFCQAGFLATGADGSLFVTSENRLKKYDATGELLTEWEGEESIRLRRMDVGPDGDIFVFERTNARVLRFDSELSGFDVFIPAGTLGGGTFNPSIGLAVDPEGNLAIADRALRRITIFSPTAQPIREWEFVGATGAIDIDPEGYLYVGADSKILKFDNKPGSGPEEEVPPHPAAILLHVGEARGSRLGCSDFPELPTRIVTQGSSDLEGRARYYIYLIGSPETQEGDEAGITGMQMGIRFTPSQGEGSPITAFGWTPCSVLDFPQDDWPASGSGNTMTWTVNPSTCQRQELIFAGYMYVSAYAPTIMEVIGYPTADPQNPSNGLAKVTNCSGAEIVVDPARLGWLSFGGAGISGSTSGCNPILEPCLRAVPVIPTTWGRIKTQYRQ